MRVFGDVPLAAMAEPLVTAIGARGGLDIARLDELMAAVDVVSRAMPADEARTLEAGRSHDGVHVRLAPVDPDRVARIRAALDSLVTAVRVDDGEVRLRVGE
jgi:hypothetical protein